MPGFLLSSDSFVSCKHAGQARPTVTNPRVKVSGQPIVTQPILYRVTNCTLNQPCLTAQWSTAATRVRAAGFPVLLNDSAAICAPTRAGLDIRRTQTRAKGK